MQIDGKNFYNKDVGVKNDAFSFIFSCHFTYMITLNNMTNFKYI